MTTSSTLPDPDPDPRRAQPIALPPPHADHCAPVPATPSPEVMAEFTTFYKAALPRLVGADLRSAQMHADIVGLAGVRWSNETRWPPEWVDCVRAASDEIEPGIFQITRTDGKCSPTYAPM